MSRALIAENRDLKILPYLIAGAILLAASVIAQMTRAQTANVGQGLEVSPPSQELTAKPGQILEVKSSIRNKSDKPLTIQARIEDFIASGDEGQVALTEKGPWSVSSWTKLSTTEFTLRPNEAREVIATVSIPSADAAGGRYGSFVYTAAGKSSAGTAGLSQEIASLFLIEIEGPTVEKLSITDFTTPSFLEFGPVPFTLSYKNSGNVHLRPHGLIAITDMFGKKVKDVVAVGTNVFPGAERKVNVVWDSKFLIGKYTALAIINSGGKLNESSTATTTFIVFPIRIAALIVIAIIILFVLRKRIIKAAKVLLGK